MTLPIQAIGWGRSQPEPYYKWQLLENPSNMPTMDSTTKMQMKKDASSIIFSSSTPLRMLYGMKNDGGVLTLSGSFFINYAVSSLGVSDDFRVIAAAIGFFSPHLYLFHYDGSTFAPIQYTSSQIDANVNECAISGDGKIVAANVGYSKLCFLAYNEQTDQWEDQPRTFDVPTPNPRALFLSRDGSRMTCAVGGVLQGDSFFEYKLNESTMVMERQDTSELPTSIMSKSLLSLRYLDDGLAVIASSNPLSQGGVCLIRNVNGSWQQQLLAYENAPAYFNVVQGGISDNLHTVAVAFFNNDSPPGAYSLRGDSYVETTGIQAAGTINGLCLSAKGNYIAMASQGSGLMLYKGIR